MAFKRLDPEDFVVSSDSITSTLWSNGNPELTTFFTSSAQKISTSGEYYLSVFEADTLINVLYQLKSTTSGSSTSSTSNDDRIQLLKKVADKQSNEIDLFKQKARYSYEQYNTLSYVEDSFLFVYYGCNKIIC